MASPRHQDYYRDRSWHFLELVSGTLEQDEIEIACELLWGAAAHAIKSTAQRRGWEHGSHALLGTTVERLVETGAPPHLSGQYYFASAFHVGFYGDRPFRPEHVTMGEDLIAEFIQTLENLPHPQPYSS